MEAVHPSCKPVLKQSWLSVSTDGPGYQAKYRLRGKDGTFRWFQAEGIFVPEQGGFWIGTLVDVHNAMEEGRVRAQETTTATSKLALMHSLVERLPYPLVFVHFPSQRIIHVNEEFLQVWRFPEAVGKHACDMAQLRLQAFNPEGQPFAEDDWPIWRACHGHRVVHQHVAVIRHDNSRCIFSMSAYPVTDEEGTPIAAFFLCEDSTEKLRTLEMAVQDRVATEQFDMRTRFLNNVSHESKTPLTATIGSLALLANTAMTVEQQELVKSAMTAASDALRRVNDLLDISRLENGEVVVSQTTFILRKCLKDVCGSITEQSSVALTVSNDVPEVLIGDPAKLVRILGTLVENGLKFKREDSTVNVSIFCRLSRPEQNEGEKIDIVFEVSDDGIGMTAETLKRAFVPFSQGNNARDRVYGGNGLGLAIANRLVKLLQGVIRIASVSQKGTTVYVELPFYAGKGLTDDLNTSNPVLKDDSFLRARQGKTVLLAEDNMLSSRVILKTLGFYGYDRVTAVRDGEEAVEVLKKGVYDMILMDCQMPRMDGYSATREIRKTDTAIPIVALTADSSVSEGLWVDAGMNGYIEKPFKPEMLIQTMDKLLIAP